jgi:hypothetical protein
LALFGNYGVILRLPDFLNRREHIR